MATIKRFVKLISQNYPAVRDMAAVTELMAQEFMSAESERGVAPKTYTDVLKLLRSCFRRLGKAAGMTGNPFAEIPGKESDTVHRMPFSAEEILDILEASKSDVDIQPLIIVAVCTAMRLGDCTRLRWDQVDLAKRLVAVKAAKTKKRVLIPIFPRLGSLFEAQPRPRAGLVFPALAKQYEIAPDVLTDRVRSVLTEAGFGDFEAGDVPSRGAFTEERKDGLRRASVRDITSFRVTWVTLGLNAGVPIELVRKVTGHQTVEIVLTHYHQPGSDDFRRVLSEKLPLALTGVVSKPKLTPAVVRDRLSGMTAESWQTIRDELLGALADA